MKRIFTILLSLAGLFVSAQSTTVVISQVYGGGGGATGTYNADYVELHNVSTVPQDISGFKIMYGSATGSLGSSSGNIFTFPASGIVIPAGGYLLVATVAGTGLAPLPVTADQTFTLTISATNGKIAFGTGAMVSNTTYALQPAGAVIDFVGYGTANESEGAAVPALNSTTAALRNNNGCQDTNNNLADFTAGTPAPRNSASPIFNCSGGPTGPQIVASALANFGSVNVLTNSPGQAFTVLGSGLTGAPGLITITSPGTDFQVSPDSSVWTASCTIPYDSATLLPTRVFARFTPQTAGLKTGNITITGGGTSAPVNVAVSGNGSSSTPSGPGLVISQLYGAGGNPGAILNADYVELHNNSGIPQSLAGYSIQYGSATTTSTWSGQANLPAATIPPGGYYLIRMSTEGTVGGVLPTPDYIAVPTILMGQTNGRVALVSDTIRLVACPTSSNIIDLVGYGTSICSEGMAAPAMDTLNAGFRHNNGCDDTNNNMADFSIMAPAPRNSATPVYLCSSTPTPYIIAGSLANFGNVLVGTNSPSQMFNISGDNLTGFPGDISITAPSTDFEVSSDNTSWGPSTSIPYTAATLASTPVYARFTPQSVGLKTGMISITGGGLANPVNVAVRGTGTVPQPQFNATPLADFGSVCTGVSEGPNLFTLTGDNLTSQDISIGPLAGFTFASSAGGPFTASLTISQPGGVFAQAVYVTFQPAALGSYNGNIPVSGGGVTSFGVPVTAAAVNVPPSVVTGNADVTSPHDADLSGTLTNNGCSAVTEVGIEYSGINGFVNGYGTRVPATTITGQDFSVALTGLVPNTTYYFKAYATNSSGRGYGDQQAFTTSSLATGLVIYGNPISRGGTLHYSYYPLPTGNYNVKILNSLGQLVFKKELNVQVNFMEDAFTVPSILPPGLYILLIDNYQFRHRRSFMIN